MAMTLPIYFNECKWVHFLALYCEVDNYKRIYRKKYVYR